MFERAILSKLEAWKAKADRIPVEVKSGVSIKGKSLAEYEKKYAPKLRLRFSMQNLKKDGNLINIPLFLADRTSELMDC